MSAVTHALGTVRYWAGQKLLHSRFHPLYLKVTGKEPKPQTYEQWLAGEQPGPAVALRASEYEWVLAPGVVPSADAAYWLMREAERSGASCVYADEDQIDASGRRHSPVFRPGWSPDLQANCGYIGGCFLLRRGAKEERWSRVPRVLFHRTGGSAPVYRNPPPAAASATARVCAIICSRDPALLESCLEGLHRKTSMPVEAIAVLHVNQGKADELRAVAARHRAHAIEYAEDFHFARMCNLAAREPKAAAADQLLFLNDDVTPLADPAWLERMSAQALRADVGAVGAVLYFEDGRIQHAGVMIGTPNGAGHPGRLTASGSPIWPWLRITREVSAVTGACLLMPRGLFHDLGGFDEIFPVNYNDVDLCLRVRKAGYRVILEAGAELRHAESASRVIGIRYAERQRFLARWGEAISHVGGAHPGGDPYFNPNLTDNELLLPDPEAHGRLTT